METNHDQKRSRLAHLREMAALGGGQTRIDSQHKRGKMTARERLEFLLDPGSFLELDAFVTHECNDFGMEDKRFLGDGVVTGLGKINSRPVYVFSQDFTVFGGSLSESFAKKITKIQDLAMQNGMPIIGINDSGGARIQEGVASLGGYAEIFYRNVQGSGVIPQLSLIMGPCAGGAVYSPAMTDFIFMVDHTSHMFITGPDVIKTVTGEEITFDALGGSETHTQKSGVCDLRFLDELSAIEATKTLLSYLPQNNLEPSPMIALEKTEAVEMENELLTRHERLRSIVPAKATEPYDMAEVVKNIVDPDSFFVIKPEFAQQMLIGFARLQGKSVGIVANNPQHLAGVLDIDASVKAARFVRACDCFNVPIITFVDVPGFLPGSDQESSGIIRHGAKLLYAFSEATVPRLTVIVRKAYGGAYDVMNSKHIRADLNVAWPTAEIAVMGAEGACNIIFKKDIAEAKDPKQKRKELVADYTQKFANPFVAASKGYIDSVILPEETRGVLIKALASSLSKRVKTTPKKHGNIPL